MNNHGRLIHTAASGALGARFAGEFYDLTTAAREALIADVIDLHDAENLPTFYDAVNVLHRRIRPATLDSYTRTLLAGWK